MITSICYIFKDNKLVKSYKFKLQKVSKKNKELIKQSEKL